MSDQLRVLAVQVAADIPDDAAAVTAIRAAGGKSKNWKIAAASMEHGPAHWPETTRRIAIDPLTRGTRSRKRLPARASWPSQVTRAPHAATEQRAVGPGSH
jgi:hypothetical protein